MVLSRRVSRVALGVAITFSGFGQPVAAFYAQTPSHLLPSSAKSIAGNAARFSGPAQSQTWCVRQKQKMPRWRSEQSSRTGAKAAFSSRDTRLRIYMVPEDKATTAQATDGMESLLPQGIQAELSRINRDPAKLTLVLNTVVVFLFGAFAAYKLATVDMDISRGWTWYEILIRVPGDNFYRYEATVSESPIITKALTSCVAYGLGDLTAQFFTGKDLETVDLWRTSRSATAGLVVHGPLCHFWIQLMQTYLDFNGAWWAFIPKVIADQTVWSIFLNAAYSTTIMSLQGMAPSNVWKEVKTTAWPALTSSWRFWPLIHCVSFSSIIPTDLKLLFIDCMEIIWVTILSTVANKDREGKDGDGPDPMDMDPDMDINVDMDMNMNMDMSENLDVPPGGLATTSSPSRLSMLMEEETVVP